MKYKDKSSIIMKELRDKGVISVAEISSELDISEVSVRKTLQKMENSGLVKRTFGGAVLRTVEPSKEQRLMNIQRIAERAAKEINDGDSVILNAGNTTLLVAKALIGCSNIKIITNSISVAKELSHQEDIQLIFLGGEMNSDAVFTFGRDAITQLEQYKADKLILSVSGISRDKGLTTRHMVAADLMRKMIDRSKKVIAVADDTKIGFESFYHVGNIDSIEKIITNKSAENEEELKKLSKNNIEVIIC